MFQVLPLPVAARTPIAPSMAARQHGSRFGQLVKGRTAMKLQDPGHKQWARQQVADSFGPVVDAVVQRYGNDDMFGNTTYTLRPVIKWLAPYRRYFTGYRLSFNRPAHVLDPADQTLHDIPLVFHETMYFDPESEQNPDNLRPETVFEMLGCMKRNACQQVTEIEDNPAELADEFDMPLSELAQLTEVDMSSATFQ
ncbi:MAG: hypothetical protein KC476_07710 [Cyanobacteria bacterium HKST-UBA06]|nr:hypothetical protein [Cyanobacteria bacterium HKST-UBA06]